MIRLWLGWNRRRRSENLIHHVLSILKERWIDVVINVLDKPTLTVLVLAFFATPRIVWVWPDVIQPIAVCTNFQ